MSKFIEISQFISRGSGFGDNLPTIVNIDHIVAIHPYSNNDKYTLIKTSQGDTFWVEGSYLNIRKKINECILLGS